MNDVLSYVQYVITQNSMTDHSKRHSTDVFDNSRRCYKYLSAILIYNALTESTYLQATLLRVYSESSTSIKLNSEVDRLLINISKKFRISNFIGLVNLYRQHLCDLLTGIDNIVRYA